jgi:hypothetical protein
MDLHLQLRPTDGVPLQDPSRYRHTVGSLVYLTVTRPDIAHAVHILSQFVCAPSPLTSVHFGHLLRVLRYLRGHHLSTCSILVIVRFSFMLTRTPLGRVTLMIDVPSLVTAFFLALLLLLGSPRSKQLYLVLVQRLNFEPWLLQLQRLYGFVGC